MDMVLKWNEMDEQNPRRRPMAGKRAQKPIALFRSDSVLAMATCVRAIEPPPSNGINEGNEKGKY
jgi:hypothetical protein